MNKTEPTTIEGFICNKQSHWFAIRKINDRYWNLNSTLERPELISHFKVATEIDKLIADGYSVFCVAVEQALPPACLNVQEMERRKDRQPRGLGGNWWRESDLLSGTSGGVTNGSKGGDPWKNVGSGMRLDGKPTAGGASSNNSSNNNDWMQALTEEEQLQMAVAASLETPAAPPSPAAPSITTVPVPPEPAAKTPGSVRIQFRLPSNPRLVRRFMESDSVSVVLSFCQEQNPGKSLDVRYGFPPKDLKPLAQQTIAEAKLNGEAIQVRCI
jgi:ataxin-3